MATKLEPKSDDQSTQVTKDDIKGLFDRLSTQSSTEPQNSIPSARKNMRLEADITAIYEQAYLQRNLLLKFFIWYTCILSCFVLTIVFIQMFARLYIIGLETFEVVPQWVLYLLVIGMFGQFIGLLTIVTKKVWTFEPFFKHFSDSTNLNTRDTDG